MTDSKLREAIDRLSYHYGISESETERLRALVDEAVECIKLEAARAERERLIGLFRQEAEMARASRDAGWEAVSLRVSRCIEGVGDAPEDK